VRALVVAIVGLVAVGLAFAAAADDPGLSIDVDAGPHPNLYLYDHKGEMVGNARRIPRGTTYLFGPNGRVSGYVTPRGVVQDRDGHYYSRTLPSRHSVFGRGRAYSPFARRR